MATKNSQNAVQDGGVNFGQKNRANLRDAVGRDVVAGDAVGGNSIRRDDSVGGATSNVNLNFRENWPSEPEGRSVGFNAYQEARDTQHAVGRLEIDMTALRSRVQMLTIFVAVNIIALVLFSLYMSNQMDYLRSQNDMLRIQINDLQRLVRLNYSDPAAVPPGVDNPH